MPLDVKSIAVNAAVLCFFITACVGCCTGLVPFVCCKRALLGAVVAYVVVSIVIRVINHILISALIKSQIERQMDMNEHGN